MDLMVDFERFESVYHSALQSLVAARSAKGMWSGTLSSSPSATASSISALVLAERHVDHDSRANGNADDSWLSGVLMRTELTELVSQSLCWLAARQNSDGGWGDVDGGPSNLAATLLVKSAFHLTGVPAHQASVLERAEVYVQRVGGIGALRKGGQRDKTMTAAILANCALADLLSWRKTLAVAPESLLLPLRIRRRFVEAGACWADAARAAIGQARLVHAPPKNPLTRWVRRWACRRILGVVEDLQGGRGGFLESPPVTSFLVMNLASVGLFDHWIVRRGIEFLLSTVGRDGSWSVGSRPSVWDTAQAAIALDWDFCEGTAPTDRKLEVDASLQCGVATLDWLLSRQGVALDAATRTPAGGWARHGHASGLTSADATATVLRALAAWRRLHPDLRREEVRRAALQGCDWLLNMQNADGGWAAFTKGAGRASDSASATDVTSAVLRALTAWREEWESAQTAARIESRVGAALQRGVEYVESEQSPDGDWRPLWFVDVHHPDEPNRVVGTSQVLLALQELGLSQSAAAQRGAAWLVRVQHASGGWGPIATREGVQRKRGGGGVERDETPLCSIEETSAAIEALVDHTASHVDASTALAAGVQWLCEAMQTDQNRGAAAICVDFARFGFSDALTPLLFAANALARCRTHFAVPISV